MLAANRGRGPGRGFTMFGFSVGNVLSKSFSIWGKNLVPFSLMTAIVTVPALALTGYTQVIGAEQLLTSDPMMFGILTGATLLLTLLLAPLATACVTYGVLQQLRGRHASVADCFRMGMARALSVLGVSIVAGFLSILGYMAFCVPGFIIAAGYFVAAPVAVVERSGVGASLSRSWQLTNGVKLSVFGLQILIGIISGVAQRAVTLPAESGAVEAGGAGAIVFAFLTAVVTVAVESLRAVTGAVTYHDLRTEREGASSQDLAAVFD